MIRDIVVFAMMSLAITGTVRAQANHPARKAPAPLYRDPIYDGAADPVLVFNKNEKNWWMFYTARRANTPSFDVSAYHGTRIGVAYTPDQGQTWIFKGYLDLEFEKGMNTFWAPDVIYHDGSYHMFVVYIKGVRSHWGGMPVLYILPAKTFGIGNTTALCNFPHKK